MVTHFVNIFVFFTVFGNDGRPREYHPSAAQGPKSSFLKRKNPLMLCMFGEKLLKEEFWTEADVKIGVLMQK